MKRWLLLTYFILILTPSALAQKAKIDAYIDSAKRYAEAAYYSKVIVWLNNALDLNPDFEQKAKIYQILANVFTKKANYYRAIHFLTTANFYLKQYAHDDTAALNQLFWNYIKLGQLYEKISELNSAIDQYTYALRIANQLDNDKLIGIAYQFIARNFLYQGQYAQALEYYTKTISYFEKIRDYQNLSASFAQIAKIYRVMGLFRNAAELYFKALELAKQYNLKDIQLYVSSELADLMYEMKFYDLALKFSEFSIEQPSQIDTLFIVYNYLLRSRVYIKMKRYDTAQEYLSKAINLLTFKPNDNLRLDAYIIFAQLFLEQDQLSKAKSYLIAAYNIAKKLKATGRLLHVYKLLGEFYYKLGQTHQAELYLVKAYKLAQDLNNLDFQRKILKDLVELSKQRKNLNQAVEYLMSLVQLQDTMLTYNQISILEKEKLRQQTYQQIQYLSRELRQSRKYNLYLILFSAFLILVLSLVIYLFISLRRKNKLLEKQKEQIENQSKVIEKQYAIYKRLSAVASHTENSIFIFDTSGRILWVNRSFLRIYSHDKRFVSYKDKTIYQLSSHPRIRQIVREAIEQKRTVRYLNSHVINGKRIWMQTTITPLVEKDKVVELIAIESDITKYKEAEEQIRKQNEELEQKNQLLQQYNQLLQKQKKELAQKNRKLIQQQEELKANTEILQATIRRLQQFSIILNEVDNIIFVLDLEANITWVNKAFTKVTGYTLVEFARLYNKNLINFKNHGEVKHFFYSVIKNKQPVSFTSWLISKSGQKIWLQSSFTPIFKDDGQIDYIVAIETDITRLKLTEEKLAQQNNEIRSSIEYASRIQAAILPMPVFLEAIFDKNYFIFNRPRDIVSGDFYWAKVIDGKVFFAVADATGHGIPGAFMSMLGIMALNLVSSKLDDLRPNKFLATLKETIIHLLHQRGKQNETRDTMDIALCVFDFKNRLLLYSGAYIPIYIVRQKPGQDQPQVLYFPADNTTIGYDEHPNIFTTHVIRLQLNDMIYITTDGYLDQFGGEDNKKFKRRRFISLIQSIYHYDLQKQKQIIEQTFEQWKGDNFQVDDVMVFGLKITDILLK